MTQKLTIERYKWLRGTGPWDSVLWNPYKNKGCCLGHACIKLFSIVEKNIYGVATPIIIYKDLPEHNFMVDKNITINNQHTYSNSFFTKKATDINDYVGLCDAEREAKLIELFKTVDVELSFVD